MSTITLYFVSCPSIKIVAICRVVLVLELPPPCGAALRVAETHVLIIVAET